MEHFSYIDGELHCDGVPIAQIADAVGTPLYIYSRTAIEHHYTVFDSAFSVDHITCYAVKACSNLAILSALAKLGAGADIVSGGELNRALRAGIDPKKIVFSGVGKTVEEIDFAIITGILSINVESFAELRAIEYRAQQLDRVASVAIRVNPDVDPFTHPYISTGLKKNKFGVDIHESVELFEYAAQSMHLDICGVSSHIGSQLTDISPFVNALEKVRALYDNLVKKGIVLRYIDVGGGLGIVYDNETTSHPREFAAAIQPLVADISATLIFEPGRMIVGNAGMLVTKVLYTKTNNGKLFVIVDAGMNDLARPSLYHAYHRIEPVRQSEGDGYTADIVGPICETGDFLARGREMAGKPCGYLAVLSAGAYGFSMSSNYNTRPRPAEVLVEGDKWRVIRRRETFDDLIRGETCE